MNSQLRILSILITYLAVVSTIAAGSSDFAICCGEALGVAGPARESTIGNSGEVALDLPIPSPWVVIEGSETTSLQDSGRLTNNFLTSGSYGIGKWMSAEFAVRGLDPSLVRKISSQSSDDLYDSSTYNPAPFVCPVDQSQNLTLFLELQPGAEKVRLSIPRGYFDPRLKLRDNRTRRGQVLRIHGESFAPWPRELLPIHKYGPYVGFLLTDYVPLDKLAEREATNILGYTVTDAPKFEITDAIFGLETLVSDKPPHWNPETNAFRNWELYVARNDDGQITNVITCNKPGSVPYPGCQQSMESPLVDYKIRYARELLEHWQDMSRNARAFVSCITSAPS